MCLLPWSPLGGGTRGIRMALASTVALEPKANCTLNVRQPRTCCKTQAFLFRAFYSQSTNSKCCSSRVCLQSIINHQIRPTPHWKASFLMNASPILHVTPSPLISRKVVTYHSIQLTYTFPHTTPCLSICNTYRTRVLCDVLFFEVRIDFRIPRLQP